MNLKDFLKTKPLLANILLATVSLAAFAYLCLLFLKVYTHHNQSIAVPDYKGMSHKEFVSITKKKHLRCEIIDSIYVEEARPGTVIEQFPSAASKVKRNRTIYLTLASVSPEKVPMPKVTDVSLREAQSRLENIGLKVGNVSYRPSEFYNLVLEQRYKNKVVAKGEMIPEGTTIDLIVGKGLSGEKTELPVLMGLTIESARSILFYNNLSIGALVYDNSISTSYDSLNAKVWKQLPDPLKTEFIELGSSVDLWLSIDEEKLNPTSESDTLFDDSGDF